MHTAPDPRRDALLAHRSWQITLRSSAIRAVRKKYPCPTPFDCTASWQRSPIRSIAPSSRQTPWRSGCRPTGLPAPCTTSTRKSAVASGCHSAISPRARAILPGERLRYTDKFDDPNLPGEIQVTVALKPVSCGTELNIVQEGLPDAIPVEACYLGWQDSLGNLASLVEPEVNQQTEGELG